MHHRARRTQCNRCPTAKPTSQSGESHYERPAYRHERPAYRDERPAYRDERPAHRDGRGPALYFDDRPSGEKDDRDRPATGRDRFDERRARERFEDGIGIPLPQRFGDRGGGPSGGGGPGAKGLGRPPPPQIDEKAGDWQVRARGVRAGRRSRSPPRAHAAAACR